MARRFRPGHTLAYAVLDSAIHVVVAEMVEVVVDTDVDVDEETKMNLVSLNINKFLKNEVKQLAI